MNQMIAFCLRPDDKVKLKELTRKTNTSVTVRDWIKDYLKNPTPLTKESENLVQINLTVEKADAAALKDLAASQGLSMMALTRLIVEHNLQNHEAGAKAEIKEAIREVLQEQAQSPR